MRRAPVAFRTSIVAGVLAALAIGPGSGGAAAQKHLEDGLAEADALFRQQFLALGLDRQFVIGYRFHPGLSTEQILVGGRSPRGQARLDFAAGVVSATLDDAGPGGEFDLWLVKNARGGTVAPEAGDELFRVGAFVLMPDGRRVLQASVGAGVRFDLDLAVVARAGLSPAASRIAVGSRTLLEKRFFREREGLPMDPVEGSLSSAVETGDPLVRRGAHLFFAERFSGNGRTCGTCHRAESDLTLDASVIASLPAGDPLFLAESDRGLAGLEDPQLLRTRALIRANVDGFDRPPVLRSVQHTLALSATAGLEQALAGYPLAPPDHRLGWSGDGAPGRGTLNEFAFGALIQHMPTSLQRRPGIDFRVPTQAELDALEAFLLFSGRQRLVDARLLRLREAPAEQGRGLFLALQSGGKCANCHLDLGGVGPTFEVPPSARNLNLATGTHGLTPELPADDGFLADGSFNVPPVIEAADTAPFFHNNAAADVEAAVAFYVSEAFRSTPVGQAFDIQLQPAEIEAIAAFLRVLNAAENVRQVRKRVEFVAHTPWRRNVAVLGVAIADTQDALDVLGARDLNPEARRLLAFAQQGLIAARAQPSPDLLQQVLADLARAKADLFLANPADEF